MEVKKLGNFNGFEGGCYSGNTYDTNGLCPALNTMRGGNTQPMIVAMRGRNPDNPSDRRGGIPLEQRLEPNQEGICNCLTQLYKDNLVMEKVKHIGNVNPSGRVQEGGNVSPALTVTDLGGINRIESKWRIRKLTPLECWRLMGFTDEEFKAAEAVNSNTQLYKQAGNSIVVDVLVGIFRNIIDSMEVNDMMQGTFGRFTVDALQLPKMFDINKLREAEPDLFDDLCEDYPVEAGNVFISIKSE